MGKRKNFIFTNKKHSERAIMGTILGVISLVSMGIVIFLSYQKNGETPVSYGLTGLLATIFHDRSDSWNPDTSGKREFQTFSMAEYNTECIGIVSNGIPFVCGSLKE